MNGKSRLIVIIAIVVLLIGSAAASALLPSLGLGGGTTHDSVSASDPIEPIHIPLSGTAPSFVPASLVVEQDGNTAIEFSPWLALIALTGLIAVPMLGLGLILAITTTTLEKQVTNMKESDDFKVATKKIADQDKDLLKGMNELAPTYTKKGKDYDQPRWDVISTGAAIWISLVFVAVAISDTLYPEGMMTIADREINSINFLILLFTLIIIALIVVAFRTNLVDILNSNEKSDLPYDNIYLVLTGGVFMIAGIGFIGWIRNPTFDIPENIFLPFIGSFLVFVVIGAVLLAVLRSPRED